MKYILLKVGNYLENYLIIATSGGKLGRNGGDNKTYKSVEVGPRLILLLHYMVVD